MVKVSIERKKIKEEVIVDPYIPIKVKFGSFYSWEDETHYLRFGDLKYTMLEVGYSAETGIIHSVALIGSKEIYIGKNHNFDFDNCEDGIIAFNPKDFGDKFSFDLSSKLRVATSESDIVLSLSDDEVVKFVRNGRGIFGLNQNDELCSIVFDGFSKDGMIKLNSCLEYMN